MSQRIGPRYLFEVGTPMIQRTSEPHIPVKRPPLSSVENNQSSPETSSCRVLGVIV